MTDAPSANGATPPGPRREPATRRTRQQQAVSDLLQHDDEFRSAQQIHDELRAQESSVGLATVYRNLQTLAERGEVDSIRSAAGELLYRRCSTEQHHHHLVCQHCRRTVEVTGPAVETWLTKMADENGFRELRHDLEIFGTCSDCWAKRQAG